VSLREYFQLRVDTYRPDGTVESKTHRAVIESFGGARHACTTMQRQYDYDCQPVTVVVIDRDGVPVYRVHGGEQPEEFEERGPHRKRVA
jgi:hypothetical protein